MLRKGWLSTKLLSSFSTIKLKWWDSRPSLANSTSLKRAKKCWQLLLWKTNFSLIFLFIIKPASSITYLVIKLILALISSNAIIFELFLSQTLVFSEYIEYYEWKSRKLLRFSIPRVLTQNWISFSSGYSFSKLLFDYQSKEKSDSTIR